MPYDLKPALSEDLKIINYIKVRKIQFFSHYYAETCSEHVSILLHCKVRWLFKGRILARFIELLHEIYLFLKDSNFNLKFQFEDETRLNLFN